MGISLAGFQKSRASVVPAAPLTSSLQITILVLENLLENLLALLENEDAQPFLYRIFNKIFLGFESLKAHEKVPILQTESCGVGAFISYCHNLFVLERVI